MCGLFFQFKFDNWVALYGSVKGVEGVIMVWAMLMFFKKLLDNVTFQD